MSSTNAAYLAESRIPSIFVGSIVPCLIGSIFVLGRLYSRRIILKGLKSDDYWIAASWILSIVLSIMNCIFTIYGVGRHAETLTVEDVISINKLAFGSRIIYQLVLATTKIGICGMYLRVFRDRTSLLFAYGIMAVIVLYSIQVVIYNIFQCHPVSAYWTLSHEGCASRASDSASVYSGAASNLFGDVLLLAFVVPRIIPLQTGRKQKISLLCIAFMSVLVMIATIIRCILTVQPLNDTDVSWSTTNIIIWTTIEINAGLFCASAPTLTPLLLKIAPGFLSSSGEGHSASYANHNPVYETGTTIPRGERRLDSFELGHQSKKGQITNHIWRSESPFQHVVNGDGGSERTMLGSDLEDSGKIRKCFSVMVSHEKIDDSLDEDRSSEGSMTKLGHV